LPGGLISGAMIAVGAAAIAGRPMGLPPLMAHVILMTLGLSLGSMVSPQMLTNMASYPVSIAILAASTFCATPAAAFIYSAFINGTAPRPCSQAVPAHCLRSLCSPTNGAPMSRALRLCRPCG
jgi:uncharacterized membrane protein AbrB (regulator of aidB expression)